MDAYDCEQTDKMMSKRIDAIYSDPKRHAFYSCYEAAQKGDIPEGRRGGKPKGRKTICFHCGQKQTGHVEVTEQL